MTETEFTEKVKQFEQVLSDNCSNSLVWHSDTWFEVEPLNENDNSITIRYELDEVRVGIQHVYDYFSDKYKNGKMYADGFNLFATILGSRVKTVYKKKGQMHYRTDYFYEVDGVFAYFATHMTWLYPYWRKTITEEKLQPAILDKGLVEIKETTTHNNH